MLFVPDGRAQKFDGQFDGTIVCFSPFSGLSGSFVADRIRLNLNASGTETDSELGADALIYVEFPSGDVFAVTHLCVDTDRLETKQNITYLVFLWFLWRYWTEAAQRLTGLRPLPEWQFLQVNLPKWEGHHQGPGSPGPWWAGTGARGDSLQKNGEENHLMFIWWNFMSFMSVGASSQRRFSVRFAHWGIALPLWCFTKPLNCYRKREIMWKLTLSD